MLGSNYPKITREQLIMITLASAAGAYTYNFTWIVPVVGRPVWIVGLLSIVPFFPLVLWLLKLRENRPEDTIFNIIESGLGKVVSKSSLFFYYIIIMISTIALLNLFVQTVKIYFLQYTPSWVLMLFVIGMCLLFVNSGIKVLGRLLEVIVGIASICFNAGFAFAFVKGFNMENIMPLRDTTIMGVVKGLFFIFGNLSECLLLLMLLVKVLPDSKKCPVWVVKGLILWAVFFSIGGIVFIGMAGVKQIAGITGTGVNVAKLVQVGDFIRGLEVFIFIVYINQAVAKICIFLYSMQQSGLMIIARNKEKTHLVVSGTLVFIGSIYMTSYISAYFISAFLYSYILLPFSVLILTLASLGLFISNRKRRNI